MARPIVRYATTADGLEIAYQVLGAGPLDVVIVPGHHPFASLLIAKGLDVVFVSRQLGHASPATTLGVYAHWRR